MSRISELEHRIRDLINQPRKQYELLKNLKSWNQLCSSMDIIGDTELAIEAYQEISQPSDDGANYLLIYGILQCLFLQQDAVKHLAEALEIDYVIDPLLKKIRQVRNISIGHPTKQGQGNQVSSHFISRITLRKNGFTLLSESSENKSAHFTDVNIPEMVRNEREVHIKILEKVVKKLSEAETMHKREFAQEKLTSIFPQTLSYYFEKVFEGTHSNSLDRRKFASMHVGLISDVLDRFENALKKRGVLPAYDAVAYELEETKYPIDELKKFFADPTKSTLNEKGAYIFAYFVRDQFKVLKKMAEEIDEEYLNPSVQ